MNLWWSSTLDVPSIHVHWWLWLTVWINIYWFLTAPRWGVVKDQFANQNYLHISSLYTFFESLFIYNQCHHNSWDIFKETALTKYPSKGLGIEMSRMINSFSCYIYIFFNSFSELNQTDQHVDHLMTSLLMLNTPWINISSTYSNIRNCHSFRGKIFFVECRVRNTNHVSNCG